MKRIDILEILDGKWEDGTRPKDLFSEHIAKAPAQYVDGLLAGLGSDNRKVQSGCSELCSLVSEAHPALFADHIELFQKNLSAKEPILRWEAACTLGNLAVVDEKELIPQNVDTLIGYLRDKSIVLQLHCVRALVKIAGRYPKLAPRIGKALLQSTEKFPGNRIGFIVEAMGAFTGIPELLPQIVALINEHAQSDIGSVKTKARKVQKNLPNATDKPTTKKPGKGREEGVTR